MYELEISLSEITSPSYQNSAIGWGKCLYELNNTLLEQNGVSTCLIQIEYLQQLDSAIYRHWSVSCLLNGVLVYHKMAPSYFTKKGLKWRKNAKKRRFRTPSDYPPFCNILAKDLLKKRQCIFELFDF